MTQTLNVSQHWIGRTTENRVDRRCDDCVGSIENVPLDSHRLKGEEEVIGGFDLIYKDKPITVPGLSMYSSYLGASSNRIDNLRKLAKTTAARLKT